MEHFAILQHDDFTTGMDIGMGIGVARDANREQTMRLVAALALAHGDYHVAGVVEANDPEDAYRITQNGMSFTDLDWHSRSTSVGDLIYSGDGVPHLWLVVSVGMLDLGTIYDLFRAEVAAQVMNIIDREVVNAPASRA